MESHFEHATSGQRYFAALIVAFNRLFHRRRKPNCAGIVVAPKAEYSTPLNCQDVYQDPDPPTPNWGC
jgi:hypothetical protein